MFHFLFVRNMLLKGREISLDSRHSPNVAEGRVGDTLVVSNYPRSIFFLEGGNYSLSLYSLP
jgi:hypothetical protein